MMSRIPDGWVVSPGNDKQAGEAGYRILHQETEIELVYVPGGMFLMGSAKCDPEARDDEKPQHMHDVNAFWIGRTEVTVGQWCKVMGLGRTPARNDQGNNHPVVGVTWDDCEAFCKGLELRLPTEPEWEYAARGGDARKYPWGNEWDSKKCCNRDNQGPGGRTFPVGSFPEGAGWCGALDMAGNVWEWCADWYDGQVYERYAKDDLTPPSISAYRVVRGGSWYDSDPWYFRAAFRYGLFVPSLCYLRRGFRCARGL